MRSTKMIANVLYVFTGVCWFFMILAWYGGYASNPLATWFLIGTIVGFFASAAATGQVLKKQEEEQ